VLAGHCSALGEQRADIVAAERSASRRKRFGTTSIVVGELRLLVSQHS
jgi:hypothetical protein